MGAQSLAVLFSILSPRSKKNAAPLSNIRPIVHGRLLRQSAWSLSRIVVTGPFESGVYFDSDDGGLEEFQSDDSYLFQLPGANSLSDGGSGSLQYNNNYVTQNHLLNYAQFGTYSSAYWYVSDGCAAWDNLPDESEILFIGPTTSLFYPNVTPSGLGAEARPRFLGSTDSQGYECSPLDDRGFGIKTINDSLLVLKSPLADQLDPPFRFDYTQSGATPSRFAFSGAPTPKLAITIVCHLRRWDVSLLLRGWMHR